MIRKPKYILISLLVVVLIAALFFTTSCDFIERVVFFTLTDKNKNVEKGYEEAYKEALIEIEEAEIEEERLEEDRQDEENLEELISEGPITYSGEFGGIAIILIVDFKTTAVSGSISLGGDYYLDADIEGTINIETFKITATFSGIMGVKEVGREEPWNGTIIGEINYDSSKFNGEISDGEDCKGKFTAFR